ncbi:MAG: hypothetical protein EOO66_14240, partial [Methylobacterium sp.]
MVGGELAPDDQLLEIRPAVVAVRAAKDGDGDDRGAYLEELIVRRELASNHVFYTDGYDDYA